MQRSSKRQRNGIVTIKMNKEWRLLYMLHFMATSKLWDYFVVEGKLNILMISWQYVHLVTLYRFSTIRRILNFYVDFCISVHYFIVFSIFFWIVLKLVITTRNLSLKHPLWLEECKRQSFLVPSIFSDHMTQFRWVRATVTFHTITINSLHYIWRLIYYTVFNTNHDNIYN